MSHHRDNLKAEKEKSHPSPVESPDVDHKRMEDAGKLLDATTDAAFLMDPDGLVLTANTVFAAKLGLPRSEVVGRNAKDLLPWDVFEIRLERSHAAICSKRPVRYEEESEDSILDVRISPILNAKGQADKAALFIRDVTEQRLTEKALREGEETARAMLNATGDAALLVDAKGVILAANRHAANLLHLTPGQMAGLKLFDLLQPELKDVRRAKLDEVLCSGRPAHYVDDFGKRIFEITIHPIADAQDCFTRAAIFGRDVTERNRAAEALKKAEEKYRAIIENAPVGIFRAEKDGRLTDANPELARMFGASSPDDLIRFAEKLEGRMGFARQNEQERFRLELDTYGESRQQEFRFRRLDGSLFWGSVHARAVPDRWGNITGYDGFLVDVNERKRMEEALKRAKRTAEEASRMKSEFLANVSHGIRTPISGILGMTDILLADPDPVRREHLRMIRDAAAMLSHGINDILDLSKIEAGKFALSEVEFDLALALDETLGHISFLCREKGLDFSMHIDPSAPRRLKGDPERLCQILANLAGNAVKFTDEGSVSVTVSRRRSPSQRTVELIFTVADTGIGISRDKHRLLFESFRQVDGSLSRRRQGTGLGLAISKQLVEMLGGRIWLESKPGRGSDFFFTARFAPASTEAKATPTAVEHPPRETSLQILLAEDNPLGRRFLTLALERAGHEITAAEHGGQALEAMRERCFDVVIMDLQMPGMDGLEATRRIRAGEHGQCPRDIPIIALTAHAVEGFQDKALAAGMSDFTTKPTDMVRLLASIGRLTGTVPPALSRPAVGDPTPTPQREPLETASLLARYEPERLRELLGLFLEDAPARMGELAHALEQKEMEQASRVSHSLIGTLGPMESALAIEMVRALQQAAGNKDIESTQARFRELQGEMNRVLAAVQAFPWP